MENSEDKERIRIIASVAGVLFVLLGVVIFLSYTALVFESEQRFGNYWTRMRLIKALEIIPEILTKSDGSAIMVGASEIDFGVNIEQFRKTAEACDITGIAFSFKGYHNMHLPLNYRLIEMLQPFSDKVRSIFAFVPTMRLTKMASKESIGSASYLPLVYSWNTLMKLFFSSPNEALRLSFSKYFFKGMGPNTLTYLGRLSEAKRSQYMEYWTGKEYLDPEFWRETSNGFSSPEIFLEPKTFTRMLNEYKSEQIQTEIYNYYEQCCGITENDLDHAELESYLDSYENLLKTTKHLYFVYIPYRNDVKLSSTGLGKIETLERAIRVRQNFKFLNVAKYVDLEKSDYSDHLHLSHKGANKLSTLLAKVACGTQEIE